MCNTLCFAGNGELSFSIPYDIQTEVTRSEELTIQIDFSLESANSGVHFVNKSSLCADSSDSGVPRLTKSRQMFTYYYENCNKLWFPHVDSPLMPCTWRIEVTVPKDLMAVCSGDLLDVIESGTQLTFLYYVDLPVCANKIGVVVGDLEMCTDPESSDFTHFCPPGFSPFLNSISESVHEMAEILEQILCTRVPFRCFKTVFVDEAYSDCLSYAGLSIMSVTLLHSDRIIDQVPHTLRKFHPVFHSRL